MPLLWARSNKHCGLSQILMEGAMKNKRPREEREEEGSEDLCKPKKARSEEVGTNDFYGNFSSEKSIVLNNDDPWSFGDAPVSEIRGIAIRKHSYIEDYFNGVEDVGLEKRDHGDDLFEELWRPQSPLCGAAESLFGSSDYFMGANLGDVRDSGFRIWEENEELDDCEKNMKIKSQDGICLLFENDVADCVWGTPLNLSQPLCPDSLELKISTPSL